MKKKNKIERFVRDNREEFDAFEPSVDLWSKIEKQLPKTETKVIPLNNNIVSRKKSLVSRTIWQIAASVIVVLGLGFATFQYFKVPQNADPDIARVDTDQAKAAFQYASLIETKRGELRQIEQEDPELYEQFAGEIEKLDQDYNGLKSQLPQTPNQEVLVEAMIQNLQRQIDLLNTQLSIIQRIKQQQGSHDNSNKKDTIV